ncbi:MAG: exosome complex protein Rrp42 [Candidatus Ranarchaeia archaeon]|jgi:exosome complex component RRP42
MKTRIPSFIEKEQIHKALSLGKRRDGRAIDDYREIVIETGVISKANGSARVKLGDSEVIAGVKVEIGTPYPDTPNDGVATVMAEFVPMADPLFETGPPGEESIELARIVDRGIRHSEMVDTKNLCIIPGEKVYILFADVYILNNEGNLWDTAGLAVTAALATTKLPKVKVNEEDNTVEIVEGEFTQLKPIDKPVQMTFSKFGDQFVVDPSLIEETSQDARLTLSIDQNSNIVSMQKGGVGTVSEEQLLDLAKRAVKISKKIRPNIP